MTKNIFVTFLIITKRINFDGFLRIIYKTNRRVGLSCTLKKSQTKKYASSLGNQNFKLNQFFIREKGMLE